MNKISLTRMLPVFMTIMVYSSIAKSTPMDFLWVNLEAIKQGKYNRDYREKYPDFLDESPLQIMPIISFANDADEAHELMGQLPEYLESLSTYIQLIYWDEDNKSLIKLLKFLINVNNTAVAVSLNDAAWILQAIKSSGSERKIKERYDDVQFLLWLIDLPYLSTIVEANDPAAVLLFIYKNRSTQDSLFGLAQNNVEALEALSQSPDLLNAIEHLVLLGLPGIIDIDSAMSMVGEIMNSHLSLDPKNLFFLLVGYLYQHGYIDHTEADQYESLSLSLNSALINLDILEDFNAGDIAAGLLSLAVQNPPNFSLRSIQSLDIGAMLNLFLQQPDLIGATDQAIKNGAEFESLILLSGNMQSYVEQLQDYIEQPLDHLLPVVDLAPSIPAPPPVATQDKGFRKWMRDSARYVLDNDLEREAHLAEVYKYKHLRNGLLDMGMVQEALVLKLLSHPQLLTWLNTLPASAIYGGSYAYSIESVVEAAARILSQQQLEETVLNRLLMYLRLLHAVPQQMSGVIHFSHTCPMPGALQSGLAAGLMNSLNVNNSEADTLLNVFFEHLLNAPVELHTLLSITPPVQVTPQSEIQVQALQHLNSVQAARFYDLTSCVQVMLAAPAMVAALLQRVTSEEAAVALIRFLTNLRLRAGAQLTTLQMHLLALAGQAALVTSVLGQPADSYDFLIEPLTFVVGIWLTEHQITGLAAYLHNKYNLEEGAMIGDIEVLLLAKRK